MSFLCGQDEGMVDVRSRRCQEPSCTRQPSFGFEHQKPRFVFCRETKTTPPSCPCALLILISSTTCCAPAVDPLPPLTVSSAIPVLSAKARAVCLLWWLKSGRHHRSRVFVYFAFYNVFSDPRACAGLCCDFSDSDPNFKYIFSASISLFTVIIPEVPRGHTPHVYTPDMLP